MKTSWAPWQLRERFGDAVFHGGDITGVSVELADVVDDGRAWADFCLRALNIFPVLPARPE